MRTKPKPASMKVYLTLSAYYAYEGMLNVKMKRGIRNILQRLEKDPYRYVPLAEPLSDFFVVENYLFRVVYQASGRRILVHALEDKQQDILKAKPGIFDPSGRDSAGLSAA